MKKTIRKTTGWENHIPVGTEGEAFLEELGYICTPYWGPKCAPSEQPTNWDAAEKILKSGKKTPAVILNQTPADITVSAEGYFCYLEQTR